MTSAEAVEHIYNAFPLTQPGAPEDYVAWANGQGIELSENIAHLFDACYAGVFHSLEDFAQARFGSEVTWEMLIDDGYWQGDRSGAIFEPVDN